MRTKLLWVGADLTVLDPHVRGALPANEILAESSLAAGLARLKTGDIGVVVLSVGAGPDAGEQALEQIYRTMTGIPVIVHQRAGSIDDVIRLTRRGAFYVLIGEIDPGSLAVVVTKANAKVQSQLFFKAETAAWRQFLIGQSPAMLQICEIIELVAAKRCTILISGETGTGKEVIARAIHAASNRSVAPLVAVNCTALPANLIETELFGHAKGAFTGAHASRLGRFEQAHRGSIFLDEIGDLPLEAQAKLLRVLQEQEFQRVGSSETVRVDVRVLAASNIDLEQAVRERRFREDLYYRLNVVPIHLPALRERREDIPFLLQHFLEKIRVGENAAPKQISEEAVGYLQQLDWPGNVRQLEHAVHMAFAMSGERRLLCPEDFMARRRLPAERIPSVPPKLMQLPEAGLDFDEVVSSFELSLLNQALTLSGGNKARAADLLKIKRTTLLAKMKSLSERAAVEPGKNEDTRAALGSVDNLRVEVRVPEVPLHTEGHHAEGHRTGTSTSLRERRQAALLLDIDLPVRKLIARTLERRGFRIVTADSAAEALELIDCWREETTLLIAPTERRGMNSSSSLLAENFVASYRRCVPDLAVLFLSDRNSCESTAHSHARTHVLPCPFSSGDLLRALDALHAVPADSEEVCA